MWGGRAWARVVTYRSPVIAFALPLSLAVAIASGVPPQHGLYTAIVAGALNALLGGSRVQRSRDRRAAFVVILSPIAREVRPRRAADRDADGGRDPDRDGTSRGWVA
jgi:MFS superfamily sulfate permease-like transporter